MSGGGVNSHQSGGCGPTGLLSACVRVSAGQSITVKSSRVDLMSNVRVCPHVRGHVMLLSKKHMCTIGIVSAYVRASAHVGQVTVKEAHVYNRDSVRVCPHVRVHAPLQ
eukprot:982922-Pyramimonas_sp.AAC.1